MIHGSCGAFFVTNQLLACVRSNADGDGRKFASPRYDRDVQAELVQRLAQECGFELAGIASAEPIPDDWARYQAWIASGFAGEMQYMTDHRAGVRRDPRSLLQSAKSVICLGRFYQQANPAPEPDGPALISRYARGRDYHDELRESLNSLARRLNAIEAHEWKVCVDTVPLLERSYARLAGLGWIGKNTCLINEPMGSWFFLGEIVTSLSIAPGTPPPDRCGTCTRCIDACPTAALVPAGNGEWTLDARRCISYLNIELRGTIPEDLRFSMGANVFGCDICQEVCPWNSRAPETSPATTCGSPSAAPSLPELAMLTAEEFRGRFQGTPVTRPKYEGFLRNVAVAMGATASQHGNAERFRLPLEHLAAHSSELVADHARWALERVSECLES